ncbi:MAG: hypothetical protein ABI405_05635 [Parafilimonas sp.]
MKKIIFYAASLLIVFSVAAAPGSKLIQAFNQTFPNAEKVKWNDDKAGYFVSFYQNENFEKVLYNKDGNFVCSWKYSDGKELPTNIVMSLNKKYSESKILGVTELTTQNGISYEIKVSKGTKLYALNISADGSITKEEKYINQDANNAAAER